MLLLTCIHKLEVKQFEAVEISITTDGRCRRTVQQACCRLDGNKQSKQNLPFSLRQTTREHIGDNKPPCLTPAEKKMLL